MALLQTYNSSNRVITNDKTVTYSERRVNGEWKYQPTAVQETIYYSMYEYHRYCQKTYSYVGMDLATANACAAAMITKYTRTFNVSIWDVDTGQWTVGYGGSMPMAQITVQQRAGSMYDVVISVREDDVRMSKTVVSPASLFTAENARDYDTN